MDADWYEDPLGRYDGRFFDGDRWTERVSDDGVLTVDPDFPPTDSGADESAGSTDDAADEFPVITSPAVAEVGGQRPLQASLIDESPVRVVAVLDEGVVEAAKPASSSTRPAGTASSGDDRSFLVWGLLGLVGVLAIVGLLLWRSGDDATPVAEQVELDEQQEERVQDLAAGGSDGSAESDVIEELEVDAPVGAVESDAVFDSDEAVEVGSLRILNGARVLQELEVWHAEFAAERGVELGPNAGCWFGQLGGAAVQEAQCGPVGGSAESEFLFDRVPLSFEQTEDGQIAQPVVDAATIDGVLPNALSLVGSNESPLPPVTDE